MSTPAPANHRPNPRPTIGITLGDPGGIGPEIILRALVKPELRRAARYVIYGLNELLNYAADGFEIEPFWFRVQHDSPRAGMTLHRDVIVFDYDEFDGLTAAAHEPSARSGAASKQFVEDAIADSMRAAGDPRLLDAIVTAPISKTAWQMARFRWPGHTELLTTRTRAKRSCMMFVSPKLRVALATVHIPLMHVRDVLNIGRVFDPIDLGAQACHELGIAQPRIAVCGLNPHAGEGGQFGSEEKLVIEPAIEMARNAGIDARGPFSADTVFNRAVAGEFDLVVAMYHDQGLIPVKLLAWDHAVNWTVGLPVIRTSPDHGTAFDIAGKNRANPSSMIAALELAVMLATRKRDGEMQGKSDGTNMKPRTAVDAPGENGETEPQ